MNRNTEYDNIPSNLDREFWFWPLEHRTFVTYHLIVKIWGKLYQNLAKKKWLRADWLCNDWQDMSIGKKRIVIMGTRTIFAKHNAYGYFLETLNMTLNLFERFLMDCNFDLTPLVAVVITENLLILLLRAIDWNVQSDLVCVREKPLVKR